MHSVRRADTPNTTDHAIGTAMIVFGRFAALWDATLAIVYLQLIRVAVRSYSGHDILAVALSLWACTR